MELKDAQNIRKISDCTIENTQQGHWIYFKDTETLAKLHTHIRRVIWKAIKISLLQNFSTSNLPEYMYHAAFLTRNQCSITITAEFKNLW
jgi:hypothetical protein